MEGFEGKAGALDVRTSSAASQRALTDFREAVAGHIAAIQRAGREFLAVSGASEAEPRREIQVKIGVGPGGETDSPYMSVDCWDEDVICGKGQSGYTHCTVHVCMIVGPIE